MVWRISLHEGVMSVVNIYLDRPFLKFIWFLKFLACGYPLLRGGLTLQRWQPSGGIEKKSIQWTLFNRETQSFVIWPVLDTKKDNKNRFHLRVSISETRKSNLFKIPAIYTFPTRLVWIFLKAYYRVSIKEYIDVRDNLFVKL